MSEGEPRLSEEQRLAELIRKAQDVYICGNGGSASTAEHFATDLVKKGVRATALSANSSVITMIANDYGYEQVFSRQLETFGTQEDLLIAISCSGTSPNVLMAVKTAILKKIPFYTFEAFGEDRDYAKLEDKHLAFAHEVAGRL